MISAGELSMIACRRCLAGAALGLGPAALGEVDELAEEVQRPLAVAVHERDVTSAWMTRRRRACSASRWRTNAAGPASSSANSGAVEVAGPPGWLSSSRRVARSSCSVRPSIRHSARFRRSQRAVEVDQRHADRRVVEGAAEELLGGAQRVLDAAALGDVLAGAVDDGRASRRSSSTTTSPRAWTIRSSPSARTIR